MRDLFVFGDLAGARTQDPLLKREMLYQLSYQVFQNRLQIYLLLSFYNNKMKNLLLIFF